MTMQEVASILYAGMQGNPPRHDNPASEFHAHLEQCQQCRENPFGLCATGYRMLAVATETKTT